MVIIRYSPRRALQSIYTSIDIITNYDNKINLKFLIKICAFRRRAKRRQGRNEIKNGNQFEILESRTTIDDYLDVLNRLHLIENQEAYSENFRSI